MLTLPQIALIAGLCAVGGVWLWAAVRDKAMREAPPPAEESKNAPFLVGLLVGLAIVVVVYAIGSSAWVSQSATPVSLTTFQP